MTDMLARVAEGIRNAGLRWLKENDPKRMTLGWADVPDEVFARGAIEVMSPAVIKAIREESLFSLQDESDIAYNRAICDAESSVKGLFDALLKSEDAGK